MVRGVIWQTMNKHPSALFSWPPRAGFLLLLGLLAGPPEGVLRGEETEETEDPIEDMVDQEEASETEDFEKLAHSVLIEAEEMSGLSGPDGKAEGWALSAETPPYTSRQCVRGRSPGALSRLVHVPASGQYAVWARYRVESGKRAPFILRLDGGGQTHFEHVYYRDAVQGGTVKDLQEERNLWFDLPGLQEGIFSGKEWVWERADAKLPEGDWTLALEARPATPGYSHLVDAVLLTRSSAYRPKFTDFESVWVRYRPVEVEPPESELTVEVEVQWLRLVILHGRDMIATGAGVLKSPGGQPLRRGERSEWTELHDELKYGIGYCTTTFTPKSASPIARIDVEIDIAWGPSESQILKTLREKADAGPIVGATMPAGNAWQPDAAAGSVWPSRFLDTFRTFSDLSRDRHERIRRLIPQPVGCSKFFNFCTGVVPPGATYGSSEIYRLELMSVARLGINTLYNGGDGWVRRLGLTDSFVPRYYTAGASPARYWVRRACPNHPQVAAAADRVMKANAEALKESTGDPEAASHVFGMKIGDEIGVAVEGDHIVTCEDCQHRFRQFLASEGFDPTRFGRSWDAVRWMDREEATDLFHRTLYYYSALFLSTQTGYLHAALVRAAQRHYSPEVPVAYNVNPTPIMGGMALDWFEMERHGGITCQWMEILGAIPARSSFLSDLAWGITRRRHLTMGVYFGSTADHVAFASRGCRSFIHYNYGPRTLGAADNFSESDAALLRVAATTRLLKDAEDFFRDAERPPRQVALLYSRTAEIWDEDNAFVHDRAYTYLALNHSQIPADILSEWDVEEGRLNAYRAAYLLGEHLRRPTAEKIRAWVEAGGHLWAGPGAGMRDETDERMNVLDPVYGATQVFVERKFPVRFSYHLSETPDAEIDTISWQPGAAGTGDAVPCVLLRSLVEPADAQVLAQFGDGRPAVLSHAFGKGKAILVAYAAGLTYSRFYRVRDRSEPWRFDERDRAVIAGPALEAGVERPVRLSLPGIEATRLDSPRGIAVTLIDYLAQKPAVTADIPLTQPPQRVRSVKSGDIPFRHADGRLSFDIRFEEADIVLIDAQPK